MKTIPKRTILTLIIAAFVRILTFVSRKKDPKRMQQLEFSSSSQKIGLRFTEKMRDQWRRRWLKIRR